MPKFSTGPAAVYNSGISRVIGAALVLAVALASPATAAPPTLGTVTVDQRHPAATFSAPGASSATIYFATSPDRASDGRFLNENVKDMDFLTSDEVAAGRWTSEDQLNPGFYWVLMEADSYGCDTCASGFSNLLTLDVPRPQTRYRARVKVYRFLRLIDLNLTASPLGDKQPYEVCWRTARKRERCLNGTLDGYSWNSDASDQLNVRLRGLARSTRFTWWVDGERVASRRVRTVPGL